MTGKSDMPVGRRDVLKATGGLAGGTVISTSQSVASMRGSNTSADSYTQCFNECRPITREERRLFIAVSDDDENEDNNEETPIAQQILEESGFDQFVTAFMEDLCGTQTENKAEQIVEEHGRNLWEAAVNRAQGQQSELEDVDDSLHQYDSRPLYWARLKMAAAIRQWDPNFRVSDEAKGDLAGPPSHVNPNYGSPDEVREGLVRRLNYTSRGITSTEFADDENLTRVIISGFDTFGLDSEIRRVNPSAAVALRLDGERLDTESGTVQVESVIFPVRWEDFDEGIVEDSYGPHLIEKGDEHQADLLMTISQGGRAIIDPEQWAGAWRQGARYGNNLKTREGYIPPAPGWTQPDDRLDWIETTLPIDAMIDVEEDPWEVEFDRTVVGWADSDTCPDPRLVPVINNQLVSREGSVEDLLAFAGGGGNYLSNESMYRSNRLRIALGLDDFPGGHLHISSIQFAEDNVTELTDPNFEEELQGTVDQTVSIVKAAGGAVD